jgi:hypothetical protein
MPVLKTGDFVAVECCLCGLSVNLGELGQVRPFMVGEFFSRCGIVFIRMDILAKQWNQTQRSRHDASVEARLAKQPTKTFKTADRSFAVAFDSRPQVGQESCPIQNTFT